MSTPTLVCLPPAGCSAGVFRAWGPLLAPALDVRALDPPGRNRPPFPAPATSFDALAGALADHLLAEGVCAGEYALVGHSLGGLLAYEVAHRICARPGVHRPRLVVVAGSRPPHLSTGRVFAPMLDLDDDGLLDALGTVGAVAPVLRASPARAMFVPPLRADLALLVGYTPDLTRRPLPVDLVAWHGRDDPLAPPALAAQWARHTTARFTSATFEAGHFFPQQRPAEVTTALARAWAGAAPPAA